MTQTSQKWKKEAMGGEESLSLGERPRTSALTGDGDGGGRGGSGRVAEKEANIVLQEVGSKCCLKIWGESAPREGP